MNENFLLSLLLLKSCSTLGLSHRFKQLLLNRIFAVFLYCSFSISEGSVFPDYLEVATAVVVSVFLPVHRYSVNIFSYSSPSGILDSVGKQNTA